MAGFLERLQAEQLVAIVRAPEAADAVRVGRTLLSAGIRLIEVTLTTRDAFSAIETLLGRIESDVHGRSVLPATRGCVTRIRLVGRRVVDRSMLEGRKFTFRH